MIKGLTCIFGSLALAACLASAAPTGPAYPPPGGVTLTTGGNLGSSGGASFGFSNFDFSQFGSMWWGADNPTTDGAGVQNVNAGGYMTFSGYDATATGLTSLGGWVWNSTTNWNLDSVKTGNAALQTRFLLNFIGGTQEDKATAGIASGNTSEEVENVTGNFSGNFVFEALWAGTWTPVLDFYNGANCLICTGVNTNVNFGFWYTQPLTPTPEPSSYVPVIAGLFGMVLVLRKRRLSS